MRGMNTWREEADGGTGAGRGVEVAILAAEVKESGEAEGGG